MGGGYWDYYKPAKPKAVKNGIKAKGKRGAIGKKWWSKRWIGLLESFNMGARLGRGRSYARKGQVISINIRKGLVESKVQGVRSKPYDVEIRLDPISEGGWDRVTEAMASKAIFAAKLLSGEMPTEIEYAFAEAEVPLFPGKKNDLDTDCSCPDWANPCKHIAAVYYLLAEQFDEDPFLIFKLRGKTKEEIMDALRERRASDAEGVAGVPGTVSDIPEVKPLEECLDSFWKAGDALDSFVVKPERPEVSHSILKRLGDAPFSVGKDNLATILEVAYDVASHAALQKATGESMDDPDGDVLE